MSRIVVTGASGKTGRVVVADLLAHGHYVVATDAVGKAGHLSDLGTPLLIADLTDYGQAVEVLQGADSVVHLANIPAPGMYPPAVTLNRNSAMNANVFLAAQAHELRSVVWASSETTLGLPFDTPPKYAPVDEHHFPFPTTTYAVSKVLGETLAREIAGWSGIPFVALRLSNVHTPEDYANVPSYWADAHARKWNLWGYVDARDVAAACRLALEAAERTELPGASEFVVAAADTIMNRPSKDLLAEVFPDVPLNKEIGEFETLLSIDRAREVLGYEPQYSWRDHVR
ncbi:NAD(P)-dependent oxidoreductase [Dactylosporangium sp. AC04546]|uniref:NAD-dependent epimerase/dehydratase family protein n=1 Tax=Dactylosporangium sp. AC04546 TaxID=2862460 RepID=UPI001EDDB5A5|nr:NAD(P)-dependent oxidoreductase [Dactylosporangium sp. AC04546]WVK82416.1 NAD(P)-dependent oxidoreductase [Dactylosporangium sp. AC04546]